MADAVERFFEIQQIQIELLEGLSQKRGGETKERMSIKILEAKTEEEIARCFPVMRQLRPQFEDEKIFVAQVERQRATGFQIAFLEDAGVIRAVAGYRMAESLFAGRYCYVDDLVTDETVRSSGYGSALFDWLVAESRAAGCVNFQLDSGVHRFAAHRFYSRKRMIIASHHFTIELD